ncbi:VOC family protein [Massilia sp. TWP1-3-3]|uniref:VOC family protein n=1 Tax=Massilia sp. TWP1-3-3 TaxID=2804573 RepID=UPI003CF51F14
MQLYVNIDVDDVDKAVAFYTKGLGLRLSRRRFNGAIAELAGASSPIHLLPKAAASATAQGAATRTYARHWTPVHLDFCVEDLDAALQRALDAGARLEGEVRQHAWGRIATLGDPFGHGLCLIQLAPGGYANVAG